MSQKNTPALIALCIGLFVANSYAAEKPPKVDTSKLPPPSTKKGVTYLSDIKPIFDESCVRCHGAEKPKAKLRLDSLEGALKGSEHGKVLHAGKSADSPMVHYVAHIGDPDNYMPPPNNRANIKPLTREQVSLIRAWIDQGAK